MLFFGVNSRTIFEALIEAYTPKIGLCISENQISTRKNSGYSGVLLRETVDSGIFVGRDHSITNNNYLLENDNLNLIHLDPFKEKTTDPIEQTIRSIKYLYSINPNIGIEFGTEESVFPYSKNFYKVLITKITQELNKNNTNYVVVQGGELVDCLSNRQKVQNTDFLKFQVGLAKTQGIKTKLHNCDFITLDRLLDRKNIGVDSFNFSPELAYIQNKIITKNNSSKQNLNNLLKIINSDIDIYRWFKKRKPQDMEIILANLHYVSIDISSINVQQEIKKEIKNFIKERYLLVQ